MNLLRRFLAFLKRVKDSMECSCHNCHPLEPGFGAPNECANRKDPR